MKLSIIVPTIRTHYLPRFINSVAKSCVDIEYEIIFIGPFEIPEELKLPYIKFIKSYSKVPCCIQEATLHCAGEIICHAVDDSVFYDGSLKTVFNYFVNNFSEKDAITLTYTENTNNMTSAEKWLVKNISEFNFIKNADPEWTTFVQPMMYKDMFIKVGGFDCQFEYSNHSHHDLAFRLNMLGSKIQVSPIPVSYAFHMPDRTGDHAPICDAQGEDESIFFRKWLEKPEPIIDYNNYLLYNKKWERRFNKEFSSYEEMYNENFSNRG